MYTSNQMKDLFEIKVECHSGYKADEYPKRFYLEDLCFDIEEIIDRWYQGDRIPEFPAAIYFKVLTSNGKNFILKHEIKDDKWYLWIKQESLNL